MPPKSLTKSQQFKRDKVRNARQIRSEASSVNPEEFSESGSILNIPSFVSSRKYEIKQLQQAIHNSKQSSSTRIFQVLPRKLRRRTASHNVKRIPKRLRHRALKEMKKSQQQFTQGTRHLFDKRKHGLSSRKLYRARMMVNLLRLASKTQSINLGIPQDLPTTNGTLRSRIRLLQKELKAARSINSRKLNNKLGSYDSTGFNTLAEKPLGRVKYMKRQKVFTWLPTHIWNAKRSHMFKRWGFHLPWSPTQKIFRLTHRLAGNVATSDGAMICDTSFMCDMIIQCKDHNKLKKLVQQLTKGRASLPKYINRQLFTGLMYLDSECVGPCSLLWCTPNSILIRLHPSIYVQVFGHLNSELDSNEFCVQDCRFSLGSITITGGKSLYALSHILRSASTSESYRQFKLVSTVTDTTVLPQKIMFAFDAIDPRFLVNPKACSKKSQLTEDDILSLENQSVEEEISETLNKLVDAEGRNESYRGQSTLKQLAARRAAMKSSTGHSNLISSNNKDSRIPILLLKEHESQQWTLIIPWFWVLPFWYQLNKVNRVYHMGIKQFQQLAFEQRRLNFPIDYPFTQVGYDEDVLYKKDVLQKLWNRKPPSKRINYMKLGSLHKESLVKGELGSPFCCDWNFLRILQNGLKFLGKEKLDYMNPTRTSTFDVDSGTISVRHVIDIFKLYEKNRESTSLPVHIFQGTVETIVEHSIISKSLPIIPVSCSLIGRGHPKDHARIYAIPEEDKSYWNNVLKGTRKSNGKIKHDNIQLVPHCFNLIGYLTSGSFNLSQGRGSGVGFVSAYALQDKNENLFLIRNCGETVYRLVKLYQVQI